MLIEDGHIYKDRLVTYGNAPGYRDIHLVVELNDGTGKPRTVDLYFSGEDAITIMTHVREVNEVAWNHGGPIDVKPGERRPSWL